MAKSYLQQWDKRRKEFIRRQDKRTHDIALECLAFSILGITIVLLVFAFAVISG
jgi:hypothetical protein